MALDPSIILQGRGIQLDNPIETQNKLAQLYQARNQNRLAALTFSDNQRERAGENSLSQLLADGKSGDDVVRGLASQGYGARGLAYGKQFQDQRKTAAEIDAKTADVGKTKADTGKLLQETAMHQFEIAGQLANAWVNNPGVTKAQIQSGLNAAAHSGVISPEVAQAKLNELATIGDDPKSLNGWANGVMAQVMKAKDAMAYIKPDANAVLSAKTARANNAATNAVAMRGQNMTEARARDTLQQGKVPAGYRAGADGSLVYIPGGPADPTRDTGRPATEFEGKSGIFGARAEEADRVLTGLNYRPAAVNAKRTAEDTWLVGGPLGAAINSTVLTPAEQKAEQAQRDFVNAVLRQESGAAIGASEFDNATKQYFPQPGDSKEVIAQKAANRKLSVEGLKRNAGRHSYSAPSQPSAADVRSAADAILNGTK